jgi:hypothetical protein
MCKAFQIQTLGIYIGGAISTKLNSLNIFVEVVINYQKGGD